MKTLAVLGASGHGKVVADAAMAAGWEAIEFFDDNWPGLQAAGGWPIVGRTHDLLERMCKLDGIIVGIGDCRVRAEKHAMLVARGAKLIVVVHPMAWLSSRSSVGIGTVLMAGSVVNVGAVLGEACIVNSGAIVDHDCQIGNAVHVAPGASISGQVVVGDESWIGVGASVRQGIRIGSRAVVGAGAVVVADVADGVTVVGNPARPMVRDSQE